MIPYDMLLFLSFCLICGILALLLVLTSLKSRLDRERLRARAELETQLIDRIDSSQGLSDYLAAGGLNRFDQSFGLAGEHGKSKIISLSAFGCGIAFFGAVLFFLFGYLAGYGKRAFRRDSVCLFCRIGNDGSLLPLRVDLVFVPAG